MSISESLKRQAAAQDALLKQLAEKSLGAFVHQAWPILEPTTPFLDNWHIDLLVEYLEAVSAGEIRRLLINIPPRYMKSLLVSVLWPAWEWVRNPSGRWIFASYAETLSSKHSIDRRTVIQSDWYQRRWRDRVRLATDQNVKNEFQNTARGLMVATSIGGAVTGKGGTRIVVDDPHNPTQAESDLQREAAVTFFTQTLSTRLDDKRRGAIVVVMQRLHELDLAAHCREFGYTHVSLPAEAEGRKLIVFPRSRREIVRVDGDLLWPERDGRAELDEQKRVLGSGAYAGQYQQRPAPAKGAMFRREWFRFYDELPEVDDLAQSWDMSFKGEASSDFVVGLVGARKGANIYLVELVRGRWDFAKAERQVRMLTARYPKAYLKLIEDAANGQAIISALGHSIQGLVSVSPQGGKIARAQAVLPTVEAGNVYLPNQRPWVDGFLHELTSFPRAAHDDMVDAFTQLLVKWLEPPPPQPGIRRLGKGPAFPETGVRLGSLNTWRTSQFT